MSERTTDGRSVWVEVATEMLTSAGEWTKEPLYVKCEPRPDGDGAVHLTFQRLAPNERVVAVGEEAVERAARVIYASTRNVRVADFWGRAGQLTRDRYAAIFRAALTALTEPRT